ncbi:MAG TPA: energy transducer TonB [Syntrophales bacterium]|jgi:TonB family protein|nr:energy transducer TonB [Syntrophales bacterium]HOX94451.1 energy transducer TonB [Syntrophales bacterium]HPI56739.1 energy transducer TonB [Syntrophales bacterium]HPN24836.1 energy transducer TonB [Syntrophales bacterium]HQM30271.1 energy transducer TonB [Syntrophales bacterium]
MISLEYAPRDLQGGVSLKWTILFSVLLHVVALSVLFFSPSLPSRQWTFGPVYSVDLVSPSAVMSEKAGSSPSKDILARTLRESFKEDTIVLKKTVRTTPPSPLRKHSEAEKEDRGRVDKAIDDIRRRLAASEKKGAAGPAGPAGPSGQGETNTRLMSYYSSIWSSIKGQWALPQSILSQNLEAVIDVKIARSGTLLSAQYEKKSGNSYFDESAMRAVRKASPYPPLPDWIRDDSVELGIRFRSSELR